MAKFRSFLQHNPFLLRALTKKIIHKFNIGSYEQRVSIGAVDRPHYGYCVYNAAVLARKLGYRRISVLEFGVAGGSGLLNLEYHAREIKKKLGVDIEIYGFDTGEGLPEPLDYRDLPYHWKKGFYKMDVPALQAKLKIAKLVLGNVAKTSKDFFDTYNPAPIGAISYDFDFYSSTVDAFRMLEVDEKYYLPRVFCYFDDTVGTEIELYSEFTGVRLAINEFNRDHNNIKIGLPYYLLARKIGEPWYHKIWITHFFKHSRYNDFISAENQQLPCQ
jgi:hypothetical protein